MNNKKLFVKKQQNDIPAVRRVKISDLVKRPVIIVADHSKIGKVTNFSIASLDYISAVITDTLVTNDVWREFEKAGITMYLVDTGEFL